MNITLDSPASPTERVLAALANVLTLRAAAKAIGWPEHIGTLTAAIAMAVAADPGIQQPMLKKAAGLLSAPGAVVVATLRDPRVQEVLDGDTTAAETAGDPTNDTKPEQA